MLAFGLYFDFGVSGLRPDLNSVVRGKFGLPDFQLAMLN